MTRDVFEGSRYSHLTLSYLSCASSLAQETEGSSPGDRASASSTPRGPGTILEPVAPSHGEQKVDRLEERLFDQPLNPAV